MRNCWNELPVTKMRTFFRPSISPFGGTGDSSQRISSSSSSAPLRVAKFLAIVNPTTILPRESKYLLEIFLGSGFAASRPIRFLVLGIPDAFLCRHSMWSEFEIQKSIFPPFQRNLN
jgi:hypothetical protein